MNPAVESLAERLNRDCDCTFTHLPELHRNVEVDAETHAHLFAASPVFIEAAQVREMQCVIDAVEHVVSRAGFQDAVLGRALPIARLPQRSSGVFAGFDFHLTPDGPRLIEINTNAGGAFLNVAARAAQRACCSGAEGYVRALTPAQRLEDSLHAMFLDEWRQVRGERPLRSIAIVDENPAGQYLHPEFALAARFFAARGIESCIVDPSELEIGHGVLLARGAPVDLVYNRLTDFYFENPRNEVLRTAYVKDLAVITPHPRAHALYADKQNLALLSDGNALRELGIPGEQVGILERGVPKTRVVTADAEQWWRDRKDWFFKPRQGFGSRGAYRGDKLTRRVFASVVSGDYMAQQLTPPSHRWRTVESGKEAFKVDVRCYSYRGWVQLMAARLYRGQTTNMRTAGGGFAPVYVVGNHD